MKAFACILALAVFAAGCVDTVKPETGGDSGGAYTVVVGVENGYVGSCPGALKDASDMKSLLGRYSKKVVSLTDKAATASAVKAAFAEAVKSDFAIFYFSGHGGSAGVGGPEEADGVNECIFCYDRAVVDDELWKIACGSGGRVLMVFDCCHSETMFRTPGFSFKAAARTRSTDGPAKGLLCWSGCPDDSYSYGSSSGGEFTAALRKYATAGRTYAEVWEKVSSDRSLQRQQSVRSTRIGAFDEGAKVFR